LIKLFDNLFILEMSANTFFHWPQDSATMVLNTLRISSEKNPFDVKMEEEGTYDLDAPRLCLVKRDYEGAFVFADSDRLRAGEDTKLTLLSHPGTGLITKRQKGISSDGIWKNGVAWGGPNSSDRAMTVNWDGNFLIRTKDESVFDVESSVDPIFREFNGIQLYIENGEDDKRLEKRLNVGRDFVINTDGTISPKQAPQFVLGMEVGYKSIRTADLNCTDIGIKLALMDVYDIDSKNQQFSVRCDIYCVYKDDSVFECFSDRLESVIDDTFAYEDGVIKGVLLIAGIAKYPVPPFPALKLNKEPSALHLMMKQVKNSRKDVPVAYLPFVLTMQYA
jgi:hypothetical protein